MVDVETAHLLRRHIPECAEHGAGSGGNAPDTRHVGRARFDRLGQTEIENLHVLVARDHHVLGLEIAMHDAARMRSGHTLCDLECVRDRASGRQCAAFEAGPQRFAVDELGDDERGVAVADELEDRQDVRMRQPGDAHRLALEPREPGRIGRQLRGEHLDGHVAIEPRIARPIDVAHPAGADGGDDFIVSKTGAGRQRHRDRSLTIVSCDPSIPLTLASIQAPVVFRSSRGRCIPDRRAE